MTIVHVIPPLLAAAYSSDPVVDDVDHCSGEGVRIESARQGN
jgi:hypothetical protein